MGSFVNEKQLTNYAESSYHNNGPTLCLNRRQFKDYCYFNNSTYCSTQEMALILHTDISGFTFYIRYARFYKLWKAKISNFVTIQQG